MRVKRITSLREDFEGCSSLEEAEEKIFNLLTKRQKRFVRAVAFDRNLAIRMHFNSSLNIILKDLNESSPALNFVNIGELSELNEVQYYGKESYNSILKNLSSSRVRFIISREVNKSPWNYSKALNILVAYDVPFKFLPATKDLNIFMHYFPKTASEFVRIRLREGNTFDIDFLNAFSSTLSGDAGWNIRKDLSYSFLGDESQPLEARLKVANNMASRSVKDDEKEEFDRIVEILVRKFKFDNNLDYMPDSWVIEVHG